MDSQYDAYIAECTKIQTENNELLELFEKNLKASGLSDKTVRKHVTNVDFYINEFLLRESPQPMSEGTFCLDLFLGDYFIRKCMWSTPGTIKTYAASIKKFYKYMMECGKIDKDSYDYLCFDIKENIDSWQFDCELYNDSGSLNPFFSPF